MKARRESGEVEAPKWGSARDGDIVRRLEYLDDIAFNPEHGYVILQVTSPFVCHSI